MQRRISSAVRVAALAGFVASGLAGCNNDPGNPKNIDAPPASPGETKPLPADVKKGGGKSSSGNMNRNPGANS